MPSAFNRIIVLVLILLNATIMIAQEQNVVIRPKDNSPYSRFGLGDPVDQFFAAQAGFAGMTAAFQDPFHLNLSNPASLSYLRATAFEVGFYGKYASLSDQNSSAGVWSGNLGYLALAFPLKNSINSALDRVRSNWDFGMSIALVPYSLVGYDIEIDVEDQGEVGDVSNSLKGNGGTYRLIWGNGARYKNLSFGVNLGYQFGKQINSRRIDFDDLFNSYSSEFLDEISYSGLVWSVGTQYVFDFKEPNKNGEMVPSGRRFVIGAYGNSKNNINTNSSLFYQRQNPRAGILDTILFDEEVLQKVTLPMEFTLGVSYEKFDKFRLGAEYSMGQWSGYANEAKPENLLDSYRIAVGAEIIPDALSYNSYFRRIRYRFGAFYGSDPRNLDGDQLTQYGVTLGFGFPVILPRQGTSFVNFAVEAGQFGLSDGLQETYVQMTLGFTLNDNSWFFKRKFN